MTPGFDKLQTEVEEEDLFTRKYWPIPVQKCFTISMFVQFSVSFWFGVPGMLTVWRLKKMVVILLQYQYRLVILPERWSTTWRKSLKWYSQGYCSISNKDPVRSTSSNIPLVSAMYENIQPWWSAQNQTQSTKQRDYFEFKCNKSLHARRLLQTIFIHTTRNSHRIPASSPRDRGHHMASNRLINKNQNYKIPVHASAHPRASLTS